MSPYIDPPDTKQAKELSNAEIAAKVLPNIKDISIDTNKSVDVLEVRVVKEGGTKMVEAFCAGIWGGFGAYFSFACSFKLSPGVLASELHDVTVTFSNTSTRLPKPLIVQYSFSVYWQV